MAGINPKVIWIATGGANGARWAEPETFRVLEGRKVVLFPDLGMTDKWEEKAKILNTVCRVSVSRLLEDNAPQGDRREGYDIADYFIKQITRPEAAQEPQASPEPPQQAEPERQPAPKAERPTEPENKPQQSTSRKSSWYTEPKEVVKELTKEQIEKERARLVKAFSGINVQVFPMDHDDIYISCPRAFVKTSLRQLAKKDISGRYARDRLWKGWIRY